MADLLGLLGAASSLVSARGDKHVSFRASGVRQRRDLQNGHPVLRWVGYLEKEHLIERKDHPTDRRIVFVKLAGKGRDALDAFLEEMTG